MDEELDQDWLFGALPPEPELDDLLEQHIEEVDDRTEFEPTEEELYEDHGTFLPGLHLEPIEELNQVLENEGLPQIEVIPGMPDGKILFVGDTPDQTLTMDWTQPEPGETDAQYDQRIDQLRDEELDRLAEETNLPPRSNRRPTRR